MKSDIFTDGPCSLSARCGKEGPVPNAPRALVVDDYDDAREMYAEFLAFKGYEVVQAQNGTQAVAFARAMLPDLIILDLALPDMDGIEVTRRLKHDPRTSAIP